MIRYIISAADGTPYMDIYLYPYQKVSHIPLQAGFTVSPATENKLQLN